MKKEEKRLIEIIRDVLAGKNKSEWSMQISKEEIERVIKCARVHGVLPFLQECPVFMEEPYREKLFFYLKDYAYKDAQQAYAAETLFELFEKNGIYCMPLKGIRTKQFYPYPEFRTMGDLDILYKEDQTKKLKQVMQDAGYKFGGYNIKHDEYEKDGVTIEMHRDVLFRLTNAYDYFADIWERAIHAKGKQYIYEMSLEDHYLHSVCHLAEHFVRGGIGIRMVLDIYILSETPRMDKAYVQRQLKALKLQKFEENIRSLAQLWFSDDEKTVRTEVSDELENYALSGGIFGSRETARRNGTVLYESKNKFVKQLVFPSYEVMKTSCPWLKTPILLPAAWLVRYKRALTASRGNIGYHIERAKTFDRVEDHLSIEECEYSCAGAEFYMKLLKHQGFMIHASAVEKEGKAYLFSAPSGTGKSTHAQLWRQTFKGEPIRIINDDKPAVCLQNGVFYACGTPFSGKTDKNENRKAPIQGLCMLHRGKTNKIQKITSGEALPLILPQTLFYGDEEETNLLLSFLDRFLQSVPVYKMECTMEEEAAKTAYFCMKGDQL